MEEVFTHLKDFPVVYHGSPSSFDTFNMDSMGTNGTQEGFGMYFTNSKRIASGYAELGYLYTVEFGGVKPISSTELTLNEKEIRFLYARLHHHMSYLDNWGEIDYDGYDAVMDMAVEKDYRIASSDVDLIGGICNASGSAKRALELLYETLGYDHFVIEEAEWGNKQSIYVALTPNIIRILEIEDKR